MEVLSQIEDKEYQSKDEIMVEINKLKDRGQNMNNEMEQMEDNQPAVLIENNQYDPAEITISKGMEIEFMNNDAEEHTVTSDADSFDEILAPGESVIIGFDEPGEYDYHCDYHHDMHGTVIVEE